LIQLVEDVVFDQRLNRDVINYVNSNMAEIDREIDLFKEECGV